MRARILARTIWAATVSLVAGALVLGLANRQEIPLYDVQSTIIAPTFATLGALIVIRRPGNVIGWIFLASGVLVGVAMFSGQYAKVVLAPDGPTPSGGAVAAWFSAQAQSAYVALVLFLVLLFPDGRLLSRRWRPVAWAIGVFFAGSLVVGALSPGPFVDFPAASNPFGVEAIAPAFGVLGVVGAIGGAVCIVATLVSLILRFYRSRGEERLQLKWFTYATAVGFPTPLILSEIAPAIFQVLGQFLWTLAFLSLPVSAGLAILRYRLYDIDRIINRTLVYGTLTAMLIAVYLGGVAAAQTTFRLLMGQEEPPQLAIVASTLVIAALFNPLRRRVQAFIDRRFYRRKYDAAKTLEAFSARLRDEVDLEELSGDLVSVVRDTVQPEHVSLWLRESERRAGDSAVTP
jgi:hypothetical protein